MYACICACLPAFVPACHLPPYLLQVPAHPDVSSLLGAGFSFEVLCNFTKVRFSGLAVVCQRPGDNSFFLIRQHLLDDIHDVRDGLYPARWCCHAPHCRDGPEKSQRRKALNSVDTNTILISIAQVVLTSPRPRTSSQSGCSCPSLASLSPSMFRVQVQEPVDPK